MGWTITKLVGARNRLQYKVDVDGVADGEVIANATILADLAGQDFKQMHDLFAVSGLANRAAAEARITYSGKVTITFEPQVSAADVIVDGTYGAAIDASAGLPVISLRSATARGVVRYLYTLEFHPIFITP